MSAHPTLAQFITAIQSVADSKDLTPSLTAMQQWQDNIWHALQDNNLSVTQLNPEGDIAQQIAQFTAWLQQTQQDSQTAYTQLSATQHLIEQFEQKVMFLLYGKFNAGKSSLCNVLAECFRNHQQTVQYFYLDNGEIVFTDEAFAEGSIETTARLQGVILGEHLVLLDTPGLHSVTAANAALTQRFLESADGVLWLSSSSSPGQVHELDSLAQELLRQKPLLPIITRSDYFDEDEVDGEICQILCNKPAAQRQLQEQDVKERAIEKLVQMHANTALLKPPISLSAHMVSQANYGETAMEGAGFNRLFSALYEFIAPTRAYKQRKPAEIVLHHLQEHILNPLEVGFEQKLTQLEQTVQQEIDSLPDKQAHIIAQAWREVIPQVPMLFDKYRPLHSTDELLAELGTISHNALTTQVEQVLNNVIIEVTPWDTLPLLSAVSYQTDDNNSEHSNSEPSIANEEMLYKNIGDSLTQALQQATDTIIQAYEQRLQQVLDEIQALHQSLLEYQQQVGNIASELRQ